MKKSVVFLRKKIIAFIFEYYFSKNCSENARDLGSPGFCGFFDFAVCGGVLCRAAHSLGPFSVIFLHFLQKYRCVPKIGFSADMFIANSIYMFVGISIDILLTFIDGRREEKGRKEGRSGSFLKI